MAISLDKLLADGCSTDAKHKVCRSRGGESCAFDGAAIVLMPIADAAHVVHGPISCIGNAWEGRGVHSTAGEMHQRGFTSDIGELDIVYGGEARLEQTVREVVNHEKPAAVFVYATCVTGLIGEDIDAVCKRLSSELWVPVIPVNAPGFVGPKNLGNRIAGETLIEFVFGTAEPTQTTPTDLTLIGEYNVAGDLRYVDPLLAECGINVLSHVTGGARFEELRYAHRAKVAALVCSRALVNAATALNRRWSVPVVEVSFFGATETARSLRLIGSLLETHSPGAAGLARRIDEVIGRRETSLADALRPYEELRGKKAVLYSGGVKSWSMASALMDLGIEILAVGTKKSSHEDEEKVRALLGDDIPLIEDISPARIRRLFAEDGADLLIAGGRNRYLAAKEGWPFIDVNQEREHAYAGYEGLLHLAEDLLASVHFYDAQNRAVAECPAPKQGEAPQTTGRTASIDPLKNAASIGAALALQGIDATLPVLHGAQGCSFLGKVLMIRHFNEPIALATTRLFTEEVVMGGEEAAEGVARSATSAATRPALVAYISGGLSEVKADDVDALVTRLNAELDPTVIAIHAPDYQGGLEEGYLAAIDALTDLAERPEDELVLAPWRVTVLAGAHLSPGDVSWITETCEDFGLDPVVLPDLSVLDGSREGISPLASGGTTLARIRELSRCTHTLVVGASLEPVAAKLRARFGTPFTVLEGAHGLVATDMLLTQLSLLTGLPIPSRHERHRRILVDAMRDAHLELSGAHVTLALEPDHALSLAGFFTETATHLDAVVPTAPAHTRRIAADSCILGDFASVPRSAQLLVSNGHGARTAQRIGAAHLETGFPVFGSYGASRVVTVGYQGATAFLDKAANLLALRERSLHPAAPTPTNDQKGGAS